MNQWAFRSNSGLRYCVSLHTALFILFSNLFKHATIDVRGDEAKTKLITQYLTASVEFSQWKYNRNVFNSNSKQDDSTSMKQQYWSWLIWKLLIIFAFNIDQEHETENKSKRWSYITSKASKHAAGPFHKRATWRLHHHHHRHNKKALLITFSIHTAIHHTVSMLYWYYILCECHLGFSNFGRFEARYSGRVLDVLKLCNKLRVGQAFKSHRAHKTETQSQWDVDAWPFDWHKNCPACLCARV